jgi:DNA primase
MSLEQLKQEIKQQPISRIIGHYLPLTKRGNQTLAICPFHDDSKPSLNVNDQRGMFMCFACNTGGDHITFVEKYKNVEFIEALKEISNVIGLDFESFHGKKKFNPELEMILKVLKKSSQIYQKLSEASLSFKSFKESRKIKDETAKLFEIGFAPSGNIFYHYLNSIKDSNEKSFALKTALKFKLLKENNQSIYDTFRDRIMFPIWDHYGKVIGYTSRATKDKQVPKYLNSSESQVFNKKNLLYPWHMAKTPSREKDFLIICEGNMDAMIMHQYGFTNSVAIMGTAFNENLILTLTNVTKNIYLALDNDNAGYQAGTRINEMFLKQNIICKKIDFGEFKDPDELLTNKGSLEFQRVIDEAKPFIDIELEKIKNENSYNTTDKKINTLQMSFKAISPMGTSILATEKVLEFARSIGIKSTDEQIIGEFKDFFKKNKTPKFLPQATKRPDIRKLTKSETTEKELSSSEKTDHLHEKYKYPKSLELLIRETIKYPHITEHHKWREVLDLLWIDEVKTLLCAFEKLYLEIDENEFSNMALDLLGKERLSQSLKSVVGAAVYNSKRLEISQKETEKLIDQLIKRLKKDGLQMKREKLLNLKLNLLSPEESQEVLEQLSRIQQEIRSL